MMEEVWEEVASSSGEHYEEITSRLRVPTGWLVRTTYQCVREFGGGAIATRPESMVFVQDDNHGWNIEETKIQKDFLVKYREVEKHGRKHG